MARVDIIMPQMGESIAEGTLSKWLKKVGDDVKRDEPIFEISTDKVDAEIPAPAAGVLAEILVKEGETVDADFDWLKPDRRREFLRVRLNDNGGLDLFANQSSGVLTSTVWADGLLDNPPGQAITRGDTVRFLAMDSLVWR